MSRRMFRVALAIVPFVLAVVVWQVFFGGGEGLPPVPEETAGAGAAFDRAIAPRPVLAAMNTLRVSRGLRPLNLSPRLSKAARVHSVEMGRRGYFAHRSADGKPFWKRIRRYYVTRGFESWHVGENLAWEESTITPTGIIAAWLNSPEHRENLLEPSWRDAGIGSAQVPHAPGFFDGADAAIVTVDFGLRRR